MAHTNPMSFNLRQQRAHQYFQQSTNKQKISRSTSDVRDFLSNMIKSLWEVFPHMGKASKMALYQKICLLNTALEQHQQHTDACKFISSQIPTGHGKLSVLGILNLRHSPAPEEQPTKELEDFVKYIV